MIDLSDNPWHWININIPIAERPAFYRRALTIEIGAEKLRREMARQQMREGIEFQDTPTDDPTPEQMELPI